MEAREEEEVTCSNKRDRGAVEKSEPTPSHALPPAGLHLLFYNPFTQCHEQKTSVEIRT